MANSVTSFPVHKKNNIIVILFKFSLSYVEIPYIIFISSSVVWITRLIANIYEAILGEDYTGKREVTFPLLKSESQISQSTDNWQEERSIR